MYATVCASLCWTGARPRTTSLRLPCDLTWFGDIPRTGSEAARRRNHRPSPKGCRGRRGGPRSTRPAASCRCPSRWRWRSGAPSDLCAAESAAGAAGSALLHRDSSSGGPSWAARCFDEAAAVAASPRALCTHADVQRNSPQEGSQETATPDYPATHIRFEKISQIKCTFRGQRDVTKYVIEVTHHSSCNQHAHMDLGRGDCDKIRGEHQWSDGEGCDQG